MELHEKSKPELIEMAKELGLKVHWNIGEETLRNRIKAATSLRDTTEENNNQTEQAIEKQDDQAVMECRIRAEEAVRAKLKAENRMKQDIAELQATAAMNKVPLVIPDEPTLADITRLKKELGIKIKQPKPAPETIAIEKSKKVYAVFHNQEERDVDVAFQKGAYRFELWPEKIHVLPEWLFGNLRETAVAPIYGRVEDKRTGHEVSERIGSRQRFLFEVIGDAPPDAEFGVVLDEAILAKLKQPV